MRKIESIPFLSNKTLKDELTGIWNGAGFEKNAKKKLDKNMDVNYMVVNFDMDEYRELDNRYDDNRGERFLCEIVEGIDSWLGNKHVLARIDSDNFILLAEKTETFLTDLADVLQQAIVRQGINKYMVSLNFTYGVYEVLNRKESITDIVNKVKMAHRMAKRNPKKNIIWYNKGLEQVIDQERYFNEHLLEGIDKGELRIYLQRQISLVGENKTCAEALVRWIMPNGRIQYPDSFVPQFERNGMVVHLDIHVLETVCRYINALKNKGIEPIQVAINISHGALSQEDFVERFLGVVNRHKVPHECLCIEVVEMSFVEGDSVALKNLTRLKEEKVVIAMDAFASGYSSLRMLPNLPLDILKMDRQFLLGREKNEKVEIVMESIITLAHDLGLKVTCEGVEHLKDMEFLKRIGCDNVQGYYLEKPVPEEEFLQNLESVEAFVQEKLREMSKE